MIARGTIAQVRLGTVAPLPGTPLTTAFRKHPVAGPVAVQTLGLVGDEQADLRVHGGPEKAVYAYPLSGYAAWVAQLPDLAGRLVPGGMGENLVVDGLDEASVHLGDIIRCGTATLQVAQIREPCSKFTAMMGTARAARAMTQSGRCGWYLRVLATGEIAAGDTHDVIDRPNPDWPISRFTPIATGRHGRREELAELSELPGLSLYWRAKLQRRLAGQSGLF